MNFINVNDEPRYVISIAARMVGVQVHTLRYYEKIGVVEPSRSQGNIRLYSEKDIAVLRRVKNLMDDLGINLAAVEVILHMSKRIVELQSEVKQLESELQKWGKRSKA
jgi:MerR family transcriptional regulator/heat shock protein HspR